MPFEGRYFDGETGAPRTARFDLDESEGKLRLRLKDSSQQSIEWSFDAIRALPDTARAHRLILSVHSDGDTDGIPYDTARLIIKDQEAIAAIKSVCPALHHRDVVRGTLPRVAVRAVVALVAIILMITVVLPGLAGTLANLIPPEREAQMGRVVVTQMERLFSQRADQELRCESREGTAALAQMLERLGSPTEPPVTIAVFDHDMINAFAAPGGQVVLMRGLIDAAESPDEVAAVLAHEVAHVVARDPTRAMLRAAGSAGLLALVFGDFAGGTAAVILTEALLDASYSRRAEKQADATARAILQNAGISTNGMAEFFDRLARQEPDSKIPLSLSTHPDTAEREARARRFAEAQADTRPALDDRQWQALRAICEEA